MTYSCLTYQSKTDLLIGIKKDHFVPIHKIADELDAKVFDQQIKTGSYFGQFPVPENNLILMKFMAQKGKKHPYFFADSASGLEGYKVTFNDKGILLQSKHVILDDPINVTIPTENINHLKQNWYPFMQSPNWASNFSKFAITGNALSKLRQWPLWHEKDAFQGAYSYYFVGTSLGQIIKVTDQKKQETIDVTDYDDW